MCETKQKILQASETLAKQMALYKCFEAFDSIVGTLKNAQYFVNFTKIHSP
jgi:hypothetical protein